MIQFVDPIVKQACIEKFDTSVVETAVPGGYRAGVLYYNRIAQYIRKQKAPPRPKTKVVLHLFFKFVKILFYRFHQLG